MSKELFTSQLETCHRHSERLRWAMDTLAIHLPLTPQKLKKFTPIELAVMDQMVVRYSKLQDTMGGSFITRNIGYHSRTW